jgi:manganese/iron transport system substrate-binding protein
VLLVALVLGLAACSPAAGDPTPNPDALRVVASTTVLADLVAQVGGPNVNVTSIVPKGGVVETFDPSPQDVAAISEADLIVMNGLGLDAWLEPVVSSAAPDAPVVRLAEDLPGVEYATDDETGAANPHLWLNVAYADRYVEKLTEALSVADPANADAIQSGSAAYRARLGELDAWVREQIDTIPPDNRTLVSFHEAFPYFARAYGLNIVGTVVGVPGQDPSAGEVAALVDAIRGSGAKAVFTEAQFNPELAEAIAEEAGVVVESDLYNDSLGDPPVDTYEGLIRWDTDKIVSALGGKLAPS